MRYRHSQTPRLWKDERNDCTVHALMNSADVSYADAYACAELAGRKKNRGAISQRIVKVADEIGLAKFEEVKLTDYVGNWRYPTLAQVLRKYPLGSYYANKRGHAFAIVNGTVVDCRFTPVGPRTRVKGLWKLANDLINERMIKSF